jgi:hypothetical protein
MSFHCGEENAQGMIVPIGAEAPGEKVPVPRFVGSEGYKLAVLSSAKGGSDFLSALSAHGRCHPGVNAGEQLHAAETGMY